MAVECRTAQIINFQNKIGPLKYLKRFPMNNLGFSQFNKFCLMEQHILDTNAVKQLS